VNERKLAVCAHKWLGNRPLQTEKWLAQLETEPAQTEMPLAQMEMDVAQSKMEPAQMGMGLAQRGKRFTQKETLSGNWEEQSCFRSCSRREFD
jgi:hypothetical protein